MATSATPAEDLPGARGKPSAERMFSHGRHILSGPYTGAAVDYRLPCTKGQGRRCHIFRHLSAWNEFLCQLGLQLRESLETCDQLTLVGFDEPSLPQASEELSYAAFALVCSLLRDHRCVETLDITGGSLGIQDVDFLCGVKGGSSIRVLKFKFDGYSTLDYFCRVMPLLSQLVELECTTDGECSENFWPALSGLLRTTTSLNVLTIFKLRAERTGAQAFLKGLSGSATVRELSFHESILSEASPVFRSKFVRYLKNSDTLNKLSIFGCYEPEESSLKWILKGLLENRTISVVNLTGFAVDSHCALLMSTVLAKKGVLRCFHMVSFWLHRTVKYEELYDCWLVALAENEALCEVTLPFEFWKPVKWKGFFQTLRSKVNLKKLNIDAIDVGSADLSKLYKHVKAGKIEKKVFFGRYYVYNSDVKIECKGFSDIFICCLPWPSSSSKPDVRKVLLQWPSFSHVTAAELLIEPAEFDETLSSLIASYIRATATLKRLDLGLVFHHDGQFETHKCWDIVFGSLSRNKSIRELNVIPEYMDEMGAILLADAVGSSCSVRSVRLNVNSPAVGSAFVRRLSTASTEKYNLLNVSIARGVDRDAAREWFLLWDMARRDAALVRRAALYATGARRDRYYAEALEQVSYHPALVEEIVEVESLDAGSATVMIRRGLRSIESVHDFMRLTGVVRKRVTCYRRKDGRTQLSDLNSDSWHAIRRYLKLEDVKE